MGTPPITNISMFRIRLLGRIFHRTSRSHSLNNFLPHTPPFPHPKEQFQPHLPSTTPSHPPPFTYRPPGQPTGQPPHPTGHPAMPNQPTTHNRPPPSPPGQKLETSYAEASYDFATAKATFVHHGEIVSSDQFFQFNIKQGIDVSFGFVGCR